MRRLIETEAHLTAEVLPELPLRQFVFTFPIALRYRLAFDPDLCAAVRRVVVRALMGFYRRGKGGEKSVRGCGGAVAMTQRFGSALNTNVHFHILAFDGLFVEPDDRLDPEQKPEFHRHGNPTDGDIERLLATCRKRVLSLLERRGIHLGADGIDEPAEEAPELAATLRSSVLDRERSRRRSHELRPARPFKRTRRLAHQDGFSLHADTLIPAYDHSRRQALVRYVLRPPFAPSQVSLDDDGNVRFRLAHPFSDGTTHFVWRPDAFLARLAALIPRPRKHLLTYHGVLAPNHRWRRTIVAKPHPKVRRNGRVTRNPGLSHSQALLRAYGFLFTRCDHCGGTKRVLAVITDAPVVRAILAHIGRDPDPPQLAPARAPPGDLFST